MFRSYRDVQRVEYKRKPSTTTFHCDFCDKGWQSESEVIIHKKLHVSIVDKIEELGKFVCWTCIKPYETKDDLRKHIQMIHFLSSETALRIEHEIIICNDCGNMFFNKKMLIIHLVTVHKFQMKGLKLQCPKCMRYRNLESIKQHFYLHHMLSPLCCPICYFKCADWDEYQTHVNHHQKLYHCPICNIEESSARAFQKHCQLHRESEPTSLVRKRLEDSLYISQVLYNAFVPKEKQEFKYPHPRADKGLRLQNELKICILCREILKSQKAMVNHLMRHTNLIKEKEKKPFACKCGKVFTYKILLKQHLIKCKSDTVEPEASSENPSFTEEYSPAVNFPIILGSDITVSQEVDSASEVPSNDNAEQNIDNESEEVDIIYLDEAKLSTVTPDTDSKIVFEIEEEDVDVDI